MPTDFVLPFSLFQVSQKGRLVYLGNEAQKILDKHQYPDLVNHYLLELMGLLSVLGSDSKTKSIVTLQVTALAESPISMIVVDLEHHGGIRAYARFDPEKIKDCTLETPLQEVFLDGHMTFTVDFEKDTKRYQAIVDLNGETLTECMQHYSKQSDQILTTIKVFVQDVTQRNDENSRLVSAMMLQQLPLDGSILSDEREKKIEEWVLIVHFLNTLKAKEALDIKISAQTLLQRLFHEADLSIYNEKPIFFKCRCSIEKVEQVLNTLSEEDKISLTTDGKITVDCEFCGTVFEQNEKKEITIGTNNH
jgi:molecular chaperone Hsp33